jgi:hypothetical protein
LRRPPNESHQPSAKEATQAGRTDVSVLAQRIYITVLTTAAMEQKLETTETTENNDDHYDLAEMIDVVESVGCICSSVLNEYHILSEDPFQIFNHKIRILSVHLWLRLEILISKQRDKQRKIVHGKLEC